MCSIKKAILKYFAIFTGKHLCLEPVFDKVAGFQGCNFIERDSNIGAFLWILQNFWEHIFWKTSAAFADFKNFYRTTESQIEMNFE